MRRPVRTRFHARFHAPRTLRGRLVALLVAVLTAGFAVAAIITVVVVRHVLIDRLDASLHAAGDRFSVGLEHNDNDADDGANRFGDVEGQLAGTLGARLLNGRVTAAAVVARHDSSDRVPPAARPVLSGLTADPAPHTVDLPDLGDYRIVVRPGRDGDLQVTGLPARPVEDTIDQLVLIEVAVFAGTLLIIVLASTGLVRLMLRPLARMAGTAADVSALPLESGGGSLPHRVPVEAHGREVDTLAAAFNTMLTQVESALTTRAASEDRLRRFIADASHELRTPVAVVRSHAEFALRSGDGAASLPDDVVRSLERITAQAGRMGHLVEDLLLLARLDSGRPLAREPVDLARTVLDALDDVRAATADHRWRLQLPTRSLWVEGDAHALSQVVANLLVNAAVHTPPGTTVTATAEATAPGGVRVVVADDGPGMDDELAAHVFDRFVRGGRHRSLDRGSSGLGLPIVAAIVAAHDGTVDLRSGADGTTVCVGLPTRGAPDANDTDEPDESDGPDGPDGPDEPDESDESDDVELPEVRAT